MNKTEVLLSWSILSPLFILESIKIMPCSNGGDSNIQIIKVVPLQLPTSLGAKKSGKVRLEILINAVGKAVKMRVIESIPSSAFKRSARKAVEKWLFSKSANSKLRCGIVVVEYKLEN